MRDYRYFAWDTANGLGRLMGLKTGTPANPTSLQDLRYYTGAEGAPTPAYDPAGNLLNIYDYKAGSPQAQTFVYDALARLTSAAASGGSGGNYAESYSYDPSTGSLSSKTGMGSAMMPKTGWWGKAAPATAAPTAGLQEENRHSW